MIVTLEAKQKLSLAAVTEPLVIEELSGGLELIERLAPEWRRVCDEGQSLPPFYHPEWVAAYVRAFAPEKKLLVITARRGRQLRAVLPLLQEVATLRGIPVRKLRSPSNVHSCHFDLSRGNDEAEVVAAIWQRLAQRRDWDVIELLDVPAQGAANELLTAAAAAGFQTGKWERPAGAYLKLELMGNLASLEAEAIPAFLNNRFKAELRRCRRRLQEQGALQLFCEEAVVLEEMEQFYQLERAGWKGHRGTAIACDSRLRQFYDELAQAAAKRRRFLLYRLACGERTIAMQFCVTDGEAVYLLKPTYDESIGKYSPGHLLVGEVIRDIVRRGFREYDLLSPQGGWKNDWTNAVREQAHCYIFRDSWVGKGLWLWTFRCVTGMRKWKQRLMK